MLARLILEMEIREKTLCLVTSLPSISIRQISEEDLYAHYW